MTVIKLLCDTLQKYKTEIGALILNRMWEKNILIKGVQNY